MMRLLPWVVAAAFAALSLGLWLSRPCGRSSNDPAAGAQNQATTRSDPSPPSTSTPAPQHPDLAPCRICTEHLAATKAALDHCRDEHDLGQVDGGLSAEAVSCVERPDVRRFIDSRVEEQVVRQAEETTRHREQVRVQEEGAVRAMLNGSLGLSEEESRFLTEYTCTVRELRQQALADSPTGSAPNETVRRIETERTELLQDLEEYLGAERYRRLRDVGGLGLLGDVVRCNDGEEPPPP